MRKIFFASLLAILGFLPGTAFAASQGSLIKLACPNGAGAFHPCKSVYFYGHDGKRHAFSNEKVYFSWYQDFSNVRTISAGEMASFPLGRNVTYRPGSKLVKFLTDPKLYVVGLGGELRWVVSEAAAAELYGPDWNRKTDDINDVFYSDYRFGTSVASVKDFSASAELAATSTIDDDLPATRRSLSIATANGTFAVDLIKLQASRWRMVSDAAETSDCGNNCPAKALSAYAQDSSAGIGIHGTYFCPPDYADCAAKTNSFLWPFFDSPTRHMLNASSLPIHQGPLLASGADGRYRYYHRASDFNSAAVFEAVNSTTLEAAIANYPSLVENGTIVVDAEAKLDEGMKTIKGTRGGIGIDEHFVQLVVAKNATVPDLAAIFSALGSRNAMNLDGGGSSALLFDGTYLAGPGRDLPNALLFVPR